MKIFQIQLRDSDRCFFLAAGLSYCLGFPLIPPLREALSIPSEIGSGEVGLENPQLFSRSALKAGVCKPACKERRSHADQTFFFRILDSGVKSPEKSPEKKRCSERSRILVAKLSNVKQKYRFS